MAVLSESVDATRLRAASAPSFDVHQVGACAGTSCCSDGSCFVRSVGGAIRSGEVRRQRQAARAAVRCRRVGWACSLGWPPGCCWRGSRWTRRSPVAGRGLTFVKRAPWRCPEDSGARPLARGSADALVDEAVCCPVGSHVRSVGAARGGRQADRVQHHRQLGRRDRDVPPPPARVEVPLRRSRRAWPRRLAGLGVPGKGVVRRARDQRALRRRQLLLSRSPGASASS